MARPLTSSAGPWSHMPVQEVVAMLTSPSSETLPGCSHNCWHICSISAWLPSMRSVMLSENSTRYIAVRLQVQEGIERGHAFDAGAWDGQSCCEEGDHAGRDKAKALLHLAQYLQQLACVMPIPPEDLVYKSQIGRVMGIVKI